MQIIISGKIFRVQQLEGVDTKLNNKNLNIKEERVIKKTAEEKLLERPQIENRL